MIGRLWRFMDALQVDIQQAQGQLQAMRRSFDQINGAGLNAGLRPRRCATNAL